MRRPEALRVEPIKVRESGQGDERLAGPIHRDVGEETVRDLVPLARTRREVADRDTEAG